MLVDVATEHTWGSRSGADVRMRMQNS
jgi:hypothetical protein